MSYFPRDEHIDTEQERENRKYDAMVGRGTKEWENGCPQYKIAGCCGKPVDPSCCDGCICPQCGRTYREGP